jgi:hypothetical protein
VGEHPFVMTHGRQNDATTTRPRIRLAIRRQSLGSGGAGVGGGAGGSVVALMDVLRV